MEVAMNYFKEFGEGQKAMAASPQSLEYCETLISYANLNTILDAGSGHSSVFFHARYENVTTVDDDPYWAGKTISYIAAHLDKRITIDPITALKGRHFDMVFYDYGNIETRIYHFKQALELCDKCMYVDDMHVSYFRDYVTAKCKPYILQLLPETTDEFGRYGALIVK